MSDQSKKTAVCYFATSYVLVGVYLAYAMFARKLPEFDLFPLFALFCTAPILAFCGGLFAFVLGLLMGEIVLMSLGLAATFGAWGIWHGVKVAIYGKK